MIEINNSEINRINNSVRCGACKTIWALEHWVGGYPFTCKKCGVDMVKRSLDPMPIRDLSIAVEKI